MAVLKNNLMISDSFIFEHKVYYKTLYSFRKHRVSSIGSDYWSFISKDDYFHALKQSKFQKKFKKQLSLFDSPAGLTRGAQMLNLKKNETMAG